MKDWLSAAKALGFTAAAPLCPAVLHVRREVRQMCAADRCHAYGRNWTCPPVCGTLEDCAAQISRCTDGILVQTTGTLADSFDYEAMLALEQTHLTQFHRLCDQLRTAYPDALCLGSGGCRICPSCAYPAPCRFPARAYSSMEGYGLLVSQVCQDAGLPYYYGENQLTYSACILYRREHA